MSDETLWVDLASDYLKQSMARSQHLKEIIDESYDLGVRLGAMYAGLLTQTKDINVIMNALSAWLYTMLAVGKIK